MSAFVITGLLLAMLCGCGSPRSKAPAELEQGFIRRDNHPAFTPQEQAAVTTARCRLEESFGKPMDAYYHVRQTSEGYDVIVFVVGRYDGTRPVFRPSRMRIVTVANDGTVTRVSGGK